jgi:uncharacterized membrane protein YkvA (DUF1232 family)
MEFFMNTKEPAPGFFNLLNRAQKKIRDYPVLEQISEQALEKFEKQHERLNSVLDELSILVRMLKAWSTRSYTAIPVRSMVMVLAAILYFLLPLDFIPDFILGVGFLDDITVIGFVVQSIRKDIEKFRQWEQEPTVLERQGSTVQETQDGPSSP